MAIRVSDDQPMPLGAQSVMTDGLETPEQDEEKHLRPAWRQRLVDAESGLRVGLRADSTLYAFMFCAATVVLASLVLGLDRWEWVLMVFAIGYSFSAELCNQLLKRTAERYRTRAEDLVQLGMSAVAVSHLTAAVVALILLWPRFASLWEK
jgi:diacylglycerol kinase (ATP)